MLYIIHLILIMINSIRLIRVLKNFEKNIVNDQYDLNIFHSAILFVALMFVTSNIFLLLIPVQNIEHFVTKEK